MNFHLMFLEPFLLLLLTLVILLTPSTIISLLWPKKQQYSHKHYSDYLSDECKNSFFINSTSKDVITDIISSLDKNKSVGPYSVPNNILILLQNDICNPLADLFNLSTSSVIFPSILKIAKLIPVYKKTLNWITRFIKPVLYYLKLKKFLKNWCTNTFISLVWFSTIHALKI